MAHSILPPSSAGIWGSPGGCTGWVLMAQTYPEAEENQDALEGNASHEIGAELINYSARGINSTTFDEFDGEQSSDGVIYTEEMFDGAKIYAHDVATIMRKTGIFAGDNLGIEQKVLAKQIHDMSYGTIDSFIFDRVGRHLYVWDYKFGHDIIEVFENWQLLNYIVGIVERFNINGIEDQNLIVHIRVIQPRAYHRDGAVREWIVKLSDLRGYFNILHDNAHISLSDNATINSGTHCKHCQARHACPAAIQAGMGLYEVAMQPLPIVLSPESLGVQLAIIKRAIKQLTCLESSFDEQVKAVIRRGGVVPNFMVEMGYGRLSWSRSVSDVIEMGNTHLLTLQKPVDVITPTQAIEQAKKIGVNTDIIKQYSKKPQVGLKIVQDNGNKAKKVFSQ